MAQAPVFKYDANLINPGVDLTLTGVGTPNLTATYGDYGGRGGESSVTMKARCTISINYANINYVINNDNSVTVTGDINGAVLVRTFVESSTNEQEVTAWFNGQQVFHQIIGTSQAGSWDLNIPNSFSVTIQPSLDPQFVWPASIHFKNRNTNNPGTDPAHLPDEFNLGLGIKNPNPPDYRPGAILDGSSVWQSHNRSGGDSHILTSGGTWREMRTINGLTAAGDPPAIRYDNKWMNMRKIGKE